MGKMFRLHMCCIGGFLCTSLSSVRVQVRFCISLCKFCVQVPTYGSGLGVCAGIYPLANTSSWIAFWNRGVYFTLRFDPSYLSHVYERDCSYLNLKEVQASRSLCQVYALLLLSRGRRSLMLLSFPWQMLSPPVPPSLYKSQSPCKTISK